MRKDINEREKRKGEKASRVEGLTDHSLTSKDEGFNCKYSHLDVKRVRGRK